MSESKLIDRLASLENEVKELKKINSDISGKKTKTKRPPSEYNKFMSKYLSDKKKELGDLFDHKTAFGEAAKEWSKKKEK